MALSFTYTISTGRDVLGDPVYLLEPDRPVSAGVIGERFAFRHGHVQPRAEIGFGTDVGGVDAPEIASQPPTLGPP
jgi:hypothetical protein